MNFEDLQKAWQTQDTGAKVTINTDVLLKEVRRNQQQFWRTIAWRDLREVGVAFLLTWYFLRRGLHHHDWTDSLLAIACFGVGLSMGIDRCLQRKKMPVKSDSLRNCVIASLHQVNHQIWLLKNVFWWYLLPIAIPLAISAGVKMWHGRHSSAALIGGCVYILFCTLLNWFLYWLNQFAVKKSLTPRRLELETLLTETGHNSLPSEIKNVTMKTTLILTLLVTAVFAAGVIIASEPPPPPKPVAATDRPLEVIRKKYDLPALAIVVVKDGQIRERSAVGVRKLGDATPVTTNDVFHIGSCTKSMTATLAAMLIEEGKLRWDTTIAEVFPDLAGQMNPQYKTVTVEQLMHHRGGVPTEPPSAAWKVAWKQNGTPVEQRREFITTVLSLPPATKPGTKMIYSNQGYAILGVMLEKITGTPWETLINQKLFVPLHMTTAGVGAPGTVDAVDQPWGHVHKLGLTVPVQLDNPPAISPAGRVHCSLDDLAHYVMLHLHESQTNGLLKAATLKKLHTPTADEDYACGWVVLDRDWAGGKALMHNGSNTMWYLVMWLAPDKDFAVIAATNIAGPDAEKACDDAATAMIFKYLGK